MNKNIFEYHVSHSDRTNDLSITTLLKFFTPIFSTPIKVFMSDTIALSISLLFAVIIHFNFSGTVNQENNINNIFNSELLDNYMLFIPLLIGIFIYGGLYRKSFWEFRELQRIVQGVALLALCDVALLLIGQTHHSSVWMLTVWPIAAVLVFVFRMVLRTVPFGFPSELQHVILVGDGITSEEFLRELRESRSGPFRILRKVPLNSMAFLGKDEIEYRIRILSDRFEIPSAQIRIVLAPSAEELGLAQQFVTTLSALQRPFSMTLPYRGLARRGLSLHEAIGADFVLANIDDRPPGQIGRALKRGIDLLLAIAAIVLLAPLLLTITILLKMERGPILFTQLRVGKDGRRFWCFKFRTMRPDAEAQLSKLLATDPVARGEWKRHQKLTNDPRVTRTGAFLRATSLDELPQLFNVVIDDMSIVGPRPIIAPEVSGYENDRTYFESADFIHYTSCKPGITGLWQVSGRAKTTHCERVRLDRWYSRNWSIWLDVMIILKTVRAVLIRTGS
jgi:undecaprenyl-phosphate galactose phosphotransferase